MAEEGHQGLQTHPGVGQGGGVGVPQLMRHDAQWLSVGTGESRGGDSLVESGPDPPRSESLSSFAEHEVCEPVGAGVRMGPLRSASGGPLVEGGQGVGVQRHGPFGAQLAERNLQPAPGWPVVDDSGELEVEQLTESQPGAAEQRQPAPRERILQAGDGRHQLGVVGRGESSR
jgi:hypothetical protein